jgi:hypothetical protein
MRHLQFPFIPQSLFILLELPSAQLLIDKLTGKEKEHKRNSLLERENFFPDLFPNFFARSSPAIFEFLICALFAALWGDCNCKRLTGIHSFHAEN